MLPLSSELELVEKDFTELQVKLADYGFTLGGNWEYDGGSFDCALDLDNKVWLRLPFEVISGNIDSELSENNARVKLQRPYVLKHLYQEGNDPEASVRVAGALLDQFQSPVDPDAEVEAEWAERARNLLGKIEQVVAR